MEQQTDESELLDGPLEPRTLAGNLRDMARFNRNLGGADLSWRALLELRRQSDGVGSLSLLDVGCGAADIPRELLRRAHSAGLALEVVGTDVRPEIVELAQHKSVGVRGLTVEQAAPDRIGARDGSFDLVHSSMVLHHLRPPGATRLLAEMARVARLGVIVNDLDRARAWWLGAWILTRVATLNTYTRHDAPMSVRRAYRPDELAALARLAGLREVARLWTRPPYRYAIVLQPA